MKWRRNLSIFILFFLTLVLSAIAPVFSVTPPSSPALQLTIEAQKLYQSGEFEAAAIRWKEAADFYARIGDREGMNTSLVNQAEALQNLGRYPLACDALLQVFDVGTSCTTLIERHQILLDKSDSPNLNFLFHPLDKQPESLLKAIALRGLGDVLQKLGDLELSTQVLQLSLKVAQNLPSPPAESSALLSLGNVEKSKGYREEQNSPSVEAISLNCPRASYSNAKAYYQRAAEYYQQAAQKSVVSATKIQANINYFTVLLALQEWSNIQIWQQIQAEINNLPTNRITIAAQINLAHNAICLRQLNPNVAPSWQEIAQLLATSAKQAEKIGDLRDQSYALGYLGRVYELTQNLTDAQTLTSQALRLAKQATAADMAYQWQWQLGRLGEKQGKIEDARAFYTEAFYTIESLRDDLVGMENPDIYFSFRDSIEPVYRELVKLLLQARSPTQNDLEFARNIIQSLNIAELEKFLRCSLVENNPKQLDEIINQQTQTAAIYPIILDNRLEIILKLPNQPLIHRWTDLPSREKVESTLEQLFIALTQPGDVKTYILPLSQTVYDWLIKPIKADLGKINTLVFVLDSDLRKIPLATLYDSDRQQFLVEQYATAVVPNSQILLSKSKQFNQVLMAGLTASRDLTRKQQTFKFLALNHIKSELQQIQTTLQQLKVDSTILIDEKFQTVNFQNQLNSSDYNIIHLATHGNFSFDPKLTFILTASPEPLDVNQLQEILLIRSQTRSQEISLLVLSACQTAQGYKRASLGLAGVAIKSGARSTLGTLWQVDDASTSSLMSRFYQELAVNKVTKAVALQQAQLSLLKQGGNQQHPYYWSPYILVGNWL